MCNPKRGHTGVTICLAFVCAWVARYNFMIVGINRKGGPCISRFIFFFFWGGFLVSILLFLYRAYLSPQLVSSLLDLVILANTWSFSWSFAFSKSFHLINGLAACSLFLYLYSSFFFVSFDCCGCHCSLLSPRGGVHMPRTDSLT